MGAGTLSELLSDFKTPYDPNLLVGYDKADDASVYRINDDTAVISTTDFFPPIVDDPYMYGQIAAANAISDVFAMGGIPKLAMNIMCVPKTLDLGIVREILRGGYDKASEAGVIITGGHTIHSAEPVYGLAVTGFVRPDGILSNDSARKTDALIITKKLGTGIITTAAKADPDMVDKELLSAVYAQMAALNKYAAEISSKYDVSSCTDITGFGFAGHAFEMAHASDISFYIDPFRIPVFDDALSFAEMGLIPEGAYKNRKYTDGHILNRAEIPLDLEDVLYDPQTSGGLLISIARGDAEKCLSEMQSSGIDAAVIGYVGEKDASGADIILCRADDI